MSTSTSPQIIIEGMQTNNSTAILRATGVNLGQFVIPKKPYNTQIGALKAIPFKNVKTQTTNPPSHQDSRCCNECSHQEHLINQRWANWVKDFEEFGLADPPVKYDSRESYKRLKLSKTK